MNVILKKILERNGPELCFKALEFPPERCIVQMCPNLHGDPIKQSRVGLWHNAQCAAQFPCKGGIKGHLLRGSQRCSCCDLCDDDTGARFCNTRKGFERLNQQHEPLVCRQCFQKIERICVAFVLRHDGEQRPQFFSVADGFASDDADKLRACCKAAIQKRHIRMHTLQGAASLDHVIQGGCVTVGDATSGSVGHERLSIMVWKTPHG